MYDVKAKRGGGERGATIRLRRFMPLFSLLLLCGVVVLTGCTATPATEDREELSTTPLVWPLPPAEPRIEFSQVISSPSDVKGKKGFFKKLAALIFGEKEERIVKPYGVTVDGTGRIIIADTALKRVHIFDKEEKKYSLIEKAGRTRFVSPVGVATDGDDNIYVSDSELKKVFKLNSKGKRKALLEGELKRPTGLAMNRAEGVLYVVDTWDHNVKAFNTEGKHIFTIGRRGLGKGKFNYPTDVFVDREGAIYVTDSMNFRVQVFDKRGKFLTLFGNHGDGSGDFARPKGIGVDGEGNIYVVDALFDVIQIFDREGNYLFGFGGTGQKRGSFWLPGGLFVDGDDNIYVADAYNRRVQVFKYLGGGPKDG